VLCLRELTGFGAGRHGSVHRGLERPVLRGGLPAAGAPDDRALPHRLSSGPSQPGKGEMIASRAELAAEGSSIRAWQEDPDEIQRLLVTLESLKGSMHILLMGAGEAGHSGGRRMVGA
jgi:hypothetical protein